MDKELTEEVSTKDLIEGLLGEALRVSGLPDAGMLPDLYKQAAKRLKDLESSLTSDEDLKPYYEAGRALCRERYGYQCLPGTRTLREARAAVDEYLRFQEEAPPSDGNGSSVK